MEGRRAKGSVALSVAPPTFKILRTWHQFRHLEKLLVQLVSVLAVPNW